MVFLIAVITLELVNYVIVYIVNTLGSKLMMKSVLVILKLVSQVTFIFAVITHELVVHVIFRVNVTFVIQ